MTKAPLTVILGCIVLIAAVDSCRRRSTTALLQIWSATLLIRYILHDLGAVSDQVYEWSGDILTYAGPLALTGTLAIVWTRQRRRGAEG